MMGNLRSPGVILLLTLFLYGTAGGASPDQGSAGRRIDRSKDLCKLQKDYFTLQFQNRLSVPRLAERIAGRDSSVILIGETHSEADNRYYPFFLEKLKNAIPALDCVTFELDEQIQYPVEYSAERWQILAERAKELGLNVFKVDHCDQAQDIFHDLPCLDGRNAFMSARLKSLTADGSCHKILHVGGSAHLQDLRIGGGANLASRLQAEGVSTYKIQLIDMAAAKKPGLSPFRENDPWIWGRIGSPASICPEFPGVLRENFGFENRGVELAGQVPVFYRHDEYFQPRPWSDFDAALVLGCPGRGEDHCEELGTLPGYLTPEPEPGD